MHEFVNVMMALLLVWAAFIDIKKKEISFNFLLFLMFVSLSMLLIQKTSLLEILGGAGIGCFFFLVSKCTREQIGYGDSWLILILGIYVGATKLVWILFAASFGAGIFSLIFCAMYQWNRKYTIPFIPFLAAAFVGVVLI